MNVENKIKLGVCIGFLIRKDNKNLSHYNSMVNQLDISIQQLDQTLDNARQHEVDDKICADLELLYDFVYSLYDKYYTIAQHLGEKK